MALSLGSFSLIEAGKSSAMQSSSVKRRGRKKCLVFESSTVGETDAGATSGSRSDIPSSIAERRGRKNFLLFELSTLGETDSRVASKT